MQRYFLVAFGGAAGALLRYFVGTFAEERFGSRFPAGTLTINLTACFLIGVVLSYLSQHAGLNPGWRYGVAVGFIGAYSTFSTFEWEIWNNITRGAFWIGISYLAVSLVGGLVCVALGTAAGKALP